MIGGGHWIPCKRQCQRQTAILDQGVGLDSPPSDEMDTFRTNWHIAWSLADLGHQYQAQIVNVSPGLHVPTSIMPYGPSTVTASLVCECLTQRPGESEGERAVGQDTQGEGSKKADAIYEKHTTDLR